MGKKKFWIILAACVLAVTLVTVGIFAGRTIKIHRDNEYTLRVTPVGEHDIVLEYGQSYQELGATAQFYGTLLDTEPVEVPVDVETVIPENAVGTYLIKYMAAHQGVVGTAYRRVQIVDTTAPEITLVADPEKYTLPNETYVEEGFTATDNHDGDITQRVNRVQTKESVTYTVTDSSGNMASVTRQIVYNDPIPPELKLEGGSVIISVGDDYREPGYKASDNCDGDLTGKVKVSGSVNTFVSGRYTLTYAVTDSYQNTVKTTRSVFVKEREVDKVNDPNKRDKVIYLTFDDGPGKNTPRLLDVLKKYNVQATFFVVNTGYIDTIKRTAAEGHTVAIHTATHRFKEIYASEDAYFADLYKMQGIIKDLTGQTAMLLRFPGGSSNTISSFNSGIMTRLTRAVQEKGFSYFDWNVDSKDAGGAKTAEKVYSNIISGIGNKTQSVVLMHDIKSYTVDAMEKLIVWALDNGYTFLPLTADSPGCHHNVNN